MELPSSSPDVVRNVEMSLDDDRKDGMSYSNSSQPKRILLPNSPLSDSSSSAPNSPSTFAFSPVAHSDDNYYASSYDTDFTSFIGSWEQRSSFGAGPSSSPISNCDKGKQKAKEVSASEHDSQLTSRLDKNEGKSIDRSMSMSHRLSFEFDFEFEQDGTSSNRAENLSSLSPSEVDVPPSQIVNNPLSPLPSFLSIPSPVTESYDIGLAHNRSISSLSLRSLRSSSSRSLDRIKRPFARKKTKSSDNSKSNSNISSPSISSPISASSFKNNIRKVFGRKSFRDRLEDTRSDALELPIGTRDEGGDEQEDPLGQSTISEGTVSPRALSGSVDKQLEDILFFDRTYATPEGPSIDNLSLDDEKIFYETTKGSGTQSSFISGCVPRDYFSELLPKELQLRILKHVLTVYEEEYHGLSTPTPTLPWTAKIAESTRWVGREKGIRMVMRLARVSKLWHSLVFDGQLNDCIRFAPYVSSLCANETIYSNSNRLSPSLLLNVAHRAGLFVRILDLRGWPHLNNEGFREISTAISTKHTVPDIVKERLPYTLPHVLCDSSESSPTVCRTLSLDRGINGETNLTHLILRTCTNLTTHTIHYVLLNSPRLQMLDLHGLGVDAVNNSTCQLLNVFCPNLERLDIGRCLGLDGTGLESLVGGRGFEEEEDSVTNVMISKGNLKTTSRLKILFASGICGINPDVVFTLARFAQSLEMLDLSYSDILDEGIGALVWWDEGMEEDGISGSHRKVEVTAREMGIDPRSTTSFTLLSPSHHFSLTPTPTGTYFKRITTLRHLNLSFTHITDKACILLAHSVPKLECIELAGIGGSLQEEGLVKLFETTPFIRRIDLEDANRVGNAVLRALTPFVDRRSPELFTMDSLSATSPAAPQPGSLLEHLILSYAQNITNSALLLLINSCTRLTTLEVDNTRISGSVVRSFVEIMRTRGTRNAKIAAMDCRFVSEGCVHELLDAGTVRPRVGFRGYDARAIGGFLDQRDREGHGSLVSPSSSLRSLRDPTRVEIDECDDTRVVIKSFWSLQALDAALEAEGRRNGTRDRGYNNGRRSGSSSPRFGSSVSGPGSLSRPRWLSNWTRYLL
ncbi:hypothetical protein Clacol_003882 [Clathrus columnatus]|uniref:RNI-like protein n=1 Tax=Clathrus columnatus TaxID=1419009 RepID=A0AAV5AAK0_9AGAM|nr:hypothetical protein Clacol_003882 [Clathrus columnatus]